MLPDGLLENAQANALDQRGFLLPALIVDQIVFKASEAYTVAAENIAGFQSLA